MSTPRECIRDAAAAAAEQLAQAFGVLITFSNEGEAAVALCADVSPLDKGGGEILQAENEESVLIFFIPRQTSFPPAAGVRINAKIVYDDAEYFVQSSSDGGLGAVYELAARRTQATILGAR